MERYIAGLNLQNKVRSYTREQTSEPRRLLKVQAGIGDGKFGGESERLCRKAHETSHAMKNCSNGRALKLPIMRTQNWSRAEFVCNPTFRRYEEKFRVKIHGATKK